MRLAILFGFCLSAPAIAAAQNEVDPWVERAAAAYRATRAQSESRTTRVRDARGEGRVLILDVELLPGGSTMLGPPHVLSIYSASLCANADAARFFGEGRTMRVDVVRDGRSLGSASTDRCPGPVGQGLSAATFAGGLQSFVGNVDRGVRIAAIRAEGSMLVIVLDLLIGTGITSDEATANFVRGFCGRPDTSRIFFDRGLTLRVDTMVAGGNLRTGEPRTRCPT